ncbi:MAG: hypothetical protein E7285_05810 [Lachnospiraceae bacterium]|nr:hypothetical protein [Lachnospiraceae bacterium]
MGRKQKIKEKKQERLAEKKKEKALKQAESDQKSASDNEKINGEEALPEKVSEHPEEKPDAVPVSVGKSISRSKIIKASVLIFTVFVMAIALMLGWIRTLNNKIAESDRMIASLNAQIITQKNTESELENSVEELNEQITFLSEALASKTETVETYEEEERRRYLPTSYPLKGSAAIQEVSATENEGEETAPCAMFVAAEGTKVVATAYGVVASVETDEEGEVCITVDHGNGYVTIYRGFGNVVVEGGDAVATGTLLMTIAQNNTEFVYQIYFNDAFVDPAECMEISG